MQFELLWGDVRLAWRNAIRRPAFTLLIVMTLALGIGVNSAVFALLDGVLLRPLPYRDPSRLVFVWQTLPEHGVFELEATPFDYDAWHRVESFSEIALVATDAYTLTGGDNPERVRGARVTASLMPLLGLHPQVGRGFTAAEDADGTSPVVIVGEGLWRRRYGSDQAIVGRTILVNGEPRTVIGVMPRGASLPGPLAGNDELWLPARMTAAERANAISHNYTILARLAGTATFSSASTELTAFAARMAAEHPESHTKIGARLVAVTEQTTRAVRPALLVIAGGVALLLLVACANAVTLLLARAASRTHEIAIRTALGATASRLLSLAVVESVIFALLGGSVGLVLGSWALQGLLPLLANLPQTASVGVDARAALFTAGLAAIAGVAFGLVVAAHRPGRLVDALRSSTRTTAGGSVARTRNVLVVAQVALAVILLSAAGLMLSSVAKLARVSPGFDVDRVASFKIAMTGSRYAPAAARIGLVGDLVERLSATPGVRDAAVTSVIPFGGTRGANGVEIEGRPPQTGGVSIIIDQRHVSPAYFRTMGIRLLQGRGFAATDDSRAERVVIINRTMAAQYWPNEDPIGRRVRLSRGSYDGDIWMRVIGVVNDVRHISLSRGPVTEMYHPYSQAPVPTVTVVVRTDRDPSAVPPLARAALAGLDANLPIYDARTMGDRVQASFASTRGTMLLLLVTAALAAALSAVAIYGSIWYSVTQRIPEIGIRLALGATRASVCRRVVSRALAMTLIGTAIGTALSFASAPLLRGLLFETRSSDPSTHLAVTIAVAGLAILASIVPARRAMQIDPMEALRNE